MRDSLLLGAELAVQRIYPVNLESPSLAMLPSIDLDQIGNQISGQGACRADLSSCETNIRYEAFTRPSLEQASDNIVY